MHQWKLDQEFSHAEGTVRYGITGAGPDVVLVHGTPWSSFSWHLMIPILAKRFKVHYFDYIGYGLSEKKDHQTVSLDIQGRLLADLINFWGLKQPNVIAHDFGGATSLRAHLLHDCEFKSLQLIDVVALAPWGSAFFTHIQKHEAAFAGVPDYIHLAVVKAYIAGAIHNALDDDQLDLLVKPWIKDGGKAAFYRQIAQADQKYTDEVEPLYSQINCPVNILWGENDSWISIETGMKLHESIPGSSFTPVPNAGHLAQLENPEFVNQQILDFL